jgi:hypothetical protein
MVRSFVLRHELLSFYLLSLLMISGAAGAAAATGIEALVLPGVVGAAIAAFVVARVAGGPAATADLRAQIVRWRVAPVWYAVAVVVLPILAVVAIAISTGRLPGASGSLFPRILILLVLMTAPTWIRHLAAVAGANRRDSYVRDIRRTRLAVRRGRRPRLRPTDVDSRHPRVGGRALALMTR